MYSSLALYMKSVPLLNQVTTPGFLKSLPCGYTVQFDLNLMLTRTVPASKNTRSACVQPGTCLFIDLHANGNRLYVIHKCTVHACASLGTRYMPTSTSNTQVSRVDTGKKSNKEVC